MAEPDPGESTRYRIGAVSRLTGISPDTLRVWERRYGTVSPLRSPRGGRLYSPEDVARLRLIKHLVDAGDAIGEVASLDMEALQGRAVEARRLPPQPASLSGATPCCALVVGESLAMVLKSAGSILDNLTLVDTYADLADFEARGGDSDADVLILEQSTLHEDTAARVLDGLERAGAAHAIVVYRYASAEALLRLPASKCSTLRAPVDAQTLQAHCLSMLHAAAATPAALLDGATITAPAPPRRYDDAALLRLATLSSAVKCECPRHLAELITGLSAFERYSTECESRNPRDAALHAYLHASASHARHVIEDALEQVMEMENIQL